MKSPVRSVVLPLFSLISIGLAQTPTPPPSAPTQVPSAAASAPPPPLPPDDYKNLSDISVELFYWRPSLHSIMRPGKGNFDGDDPTLASGLDFQGKSKAAEGILITTPAGRANKLEFEYFQQKGSGNETLPIATILFGQPYSSGDVLGSATTIQHARVTWNYLTYPDPPGAHKFRFRTLFGVEYTQMTARFDAPFDFNAAPVQGTRTIIFPSLGAAIEYHFSKRFYFEAKAEGFAWPHKAAQADGDAKLTFRVFKQLDLLAGGKAFYFKTSPAKDYYLRATMFGPYAALRWTFK